MPRLLHSLSACSRDEYPNFSKSISQTSTRLLTGRSDTWVGRKAMPQKEIFTKHVSGLMLVRKQYQP